MIKKNFSPDISIVVPVYGCENVLYSLHERLCAVLTKLQTSFEIILIHDGASSESWQIIGELADKDVCVVGIKFSRNYGQHYAITAGIDYCRGKWLVVMDCDLQDRPEEIANFWSKAQEGYEIVVGRRYKRQDSFMKGISSKLFHKTFGYMTDQESDATQANFGIYSRKVVEELKRLSEHSRCFPVLVRWLGFPTATIDIEHDSRAEGETTYNLQRLISLAIDVIVSYSNKPLKIFVLVGFAVSIISTMFAVVLIVHYFSYDIPVQGWTSVMVSLYFLSGVNLLGMGTLGIYIGRIFNQVKGRPLYVIDKVVGKRDMSDNRDE